MNKLQFDFLVDKENSTLTLKREFAADRQLVWNCYTQSELLDQWFAPAPFTTKTKSMDFSEGGAWIYAMVDTEGKEYWGRTDFLQIRAIDYYTSLDAFADAEGNINPDLPRAEWKVMFSELGEHAMVETIVQYQSLEDLETVINMGMEEGMISTLEKLDQLLLNLKR